MKYNKLTKEEKEVIINKGTERPFTGKYFNFKEKGIYKCKQCNAPLYLSDYKFDSDCGWPSFDDEISGAIKHIPDRDGQRMEIICANCGAHLGHIFEGEGQTKKNVRHCVNSISMNFIKEEIDSTMRAIFASGCFWGTEYYFQKAKGVLKTTVGYIGGNKDNPTYEDVCSGTTDHAEAVEIIFNPNETSFKNLVKLFFETHNFSQVDGQGPDLGRQYRSAIFYLNDEQKSISEELIKTLKSKGYFVATEVSKASKFWSAEDYHQKYYQKKNGTPYCHFYKKIFD